MNGEQQYQSPQQPAPSGQKNTGMAIVAYILFFIPLLTDAKNDSFVKYHVKQGLALLMLWVAVWIVLMILPFLFFVSWILYLAVFVLFIIGIMNAAGGKEKPLPIIGKLAEQIKI